MGIIITSIANMLHMLIWAYMWVLIIAVFLSWVRPDPSNPIVQVLYRLSYPVLDFARRKLYFLVFNGVDLSPLAVIIGLQILDQVIMQVAFALAR
ncbi:MULTISPECIES: YggT family protein [Helicobacter]|uniref:Integral membrane protein n=2 Tax=Helicobacter TaxID=209 RepID=A0A377J605_9HELI|nr:MULTISPECIES: YggT family protein [Helicobacter]MDL0079988.1 YggT family protein [Helicobacter sp. CPD2-1]MDL0081775.1 YggT family protein [Helicobacter sp. XJK30-2]STO97891.1 integral membrane protein [Helicobacter canis]